MAELELAHEGARFDPQHPEWTPDVRPWVDIRPQDCSWGYVIDPTEDPPSRQHVQAGDWIVWFAGGRLRVLTPEQFDELSAGLVWYAPSLP